MLSCGHYYTAGGHFFTDLVPSAFMFIFLMSLLKALLLKSVFIFEIHLTCSSEEKGGPPGFKLDKTTSASEV